MINRGRTELESDPAVIFSALRSRGGARKGEVKGSLERGRGSEAGRKLFGAGSWTMSRREARTCLKEVMRLRMRSWELEGKEMVCSKLNRAIGDSVSV
jgi:hypothetical protein